MVGVNRFRLEDEKIEIPILKIDPRVEFEQRKAVQKVREERDNDKVSRELERLKETAKGSENLMPVIIDCARCYCTEGEIVEALKEVFGEYKEPIFF